MSGPITVLPISGIPEIEAGADLGRAIASAAEPTDGDIFVVAQKVVSKAEGRGRRLADVEPSPRAIELGHDLDKDPRLVELILAESVRIVRDERVLIVETAGGLICANAGIDSSNVGAAGEVLLLPEDPDASAQRLRAEIGAAAGGRVGVVISDSFGRPWRVGQTDVAIGCAGVRPVDDWRGRPDRDGRELAATEIAVADQLAGAADLSRDKAAGVPAVLIRGRPDLVTAEDGPGARSLQRPRDQDLFR
ncbi:MAG: coenzyme F420-0:L-glutamate ligase [Solirubrobacterales bacterium]|nr:coenzyme F420-0:L-glutamate ligase [Solirubrobacterales bacterium]